MKKRNNFIGKMDERNKNVAMKVMTVMYLLTILALQGVVIYRQLALGQDIRDFEDIAVIMTVNTIFLISALLYFGAVPIKKIRIKTLLLVYFLIVVLGSLFTYLKYNVIQDAALTMKELFGKLIIIYTISGLLLLFWILFYYLGKRKLDRELDD